MSRDELRETFFLECEDLLEVLMSGLSAMDDGTSDDETINAVFRAVHSIKGGAGAFACEELVAFAHVFETSLDEVRSDRLELSRDVMGVFFRSADCLSDLTIASRDGVAAITDAVQVVLDELKALLGDQVEEEVDDDSFEPVALSFDLDMDLTSDLSEIGPAERIVEIEFRPAKEFYLRGNDTTLLIRALAEMGPIEVTCDEGGLPTIDQLDCEQALCCWTINLTTGAPEEDILEIFEFAADDCELVLSERGLEVPVGPPPIEMLDEADAEQPAEPEPALQPQAGASNDTAPAAPPKATEASVSAPPQAAPEKPRPTIRVDLDRVERLINLVGELVINQAMLAQSIDESSNPQPTTVKDGLDEFKRLTRNIQEGVMAIRAQPVKPLFQRMARIVREAAQATGKQARLVTEGAETEVDKTVVERLSDPLTHMIRNSVDHGLELPDDRQSSGKEREGIVRLSAAHRSGRVFIEISDDGRGIDRDRVKQIAIDKELIPADANLTDSEIDNLLFLPGFSTAKEVSNLSGRGVGMDVVKKAIQSLGGRIVITSAPNKGTTLTISLPLTLAVLDGIVVNVGGETLVVPLTSVVETMKPSQGETCRIDATSWALFSRGEYIPIIDVGYELGIRGQLSDLDDKVILVTGSEDGSHNALIIDQVRDQRQVVIKSLETNYGEVPGVAAATILGDGRIALILDIDVLVSQATSGGPAQKSDLALAG